MKPPCAVPADRKARTDRYRLCRHANNPPSRRRSRRGSSAADPRLPVHHVVAAQELPGRRMGAVAFLERDPPIDDGIADALSLLDQATLSSREVRGADIGVIEKPKLRLLVG